MLKLALIATVTAASTMVAAADPATAPRDLSILSPEVRARVVRLQSYGHRYDKAIDAILHAAQMQAYGWGDCGLGETGTGPAPQS